MPELSQLAVLGKYYEQFHARLVRMLDRRIDPRLRARLAVGDLVQDTYVEAHRRWVNSKGTAPIDTYVWWYTIARDTLIEAWRRHTRDMRDLCRDVPLPSRSSVLLCRHIHELQETPSRSLDKLEQRQRVREAISQLSDKEQELLWMRLFEQLSHREIGEVLRCSERAALMRYVRALKKLRPILEASDESARSEGPPT